MFASRVLCRPARLQTLRKPIGQRILSVPTSRISKFGHQLCRVSTTVPPSQTPGPPATWVDSLPPRIRPYLYLTRIDKPIGTLLLFYPCAWSITLASYATHASPLVPLGYTALFGLGALVMRGAGCTINDLWDRNLDKAVERTKTRPLARGDVTPPQAIGFLAVQLSAGLAVLTQLNWYRSVTGITCLLDRMTLCTQHSSGCIVPLIGSRLPAHEANHILPSSRPRTGLQLGRTARLVGCSRYGIMAKRTSSIRWRCLLDARLRHYLRTPGQSG
jgi:hypothetical protein